MLTNMNKADRLIRMAVSFIIAFSSLYFSALWAILGILILLTAIMGWCPIYALFHLSTAKEQSEIPANTSGQHEPQHGPKRLLK
jgi:uncharacterized SAM-binding protein YcdF (DUF218 family)